MSQQKCERCGTELYEQQVKCPRCGTFTPEAVKQKVRRFITFFIVTAVFCIAMVFLLPR